MDILDLRDGCRQNLVTYTERAFQELPPIRKPDILDIGCGTGVPTMALAGMTDGRITAVDADAESLGRLREKAGDLLLTGRMTLIHGSLLSVDLPLEGFDIVWAEGLLNVIGFRTGMTRAGRYLKSGGFFVVHDECGGREEKLKIAGELHYELINSFKLSHDTWWKEYFQCLEKSIEMFKSTRVMSRLDAGVIGKELLEIRDFRENPGRGGSVFYIFRKE